MRRAGAPGGLSWRRLAVLVAQLGIDQGSALYRSQFPDHAVWDIHAQLLAATVNAVQVANWQRTEDATKRSPKHYPEAIMPPWVERSDDNTDVTKFGSAHMSVTEANDWLGWSN